MYNLKKSNNKSLMSFFLAFIMIINSITLVNAQEKDFAKSDEQVRKQVLEMADRLLSREDLTERFLGTIFLHSGAVYPGSENNKIPKDFIDSTAWFSIWQEAYKNKIMIDSYFTKSLAEKVLEDMIYSEKLYGFEMSNHLKKDGFYTGSFKTFEMQKYDGGYRQGFYKKIKENDAKDIFDKTIGVFKTGNEIEINLILNKDKAKKINYVDVNPVATIQNIHKLGHLDGETDDRFIAINLPGEVGEENIVIREISYEDNAGKTQKIGPFGIGIDYSKLKRDDNFVLNLKEKIKSRITIWKERAKIVLESYVVYDMQKENIIKDVISKLEELEKKEDVQLNEVYETVKPVHQFENEVTLREKLSSQIFIQRDTIDSGFYDEKKYTKESIEEFKKYIEELDEKKGELSLKELIEASVKLDKASLNTILRFNIKPLEKLLKIANLKELSNYKEEGLAKFLEAKAEAQKWVDLNKSFKPSINDTDDLLNYLLNNINALVKKDGSKDEPIKKEDLFKEEQESEDDKEKVYTVMGEIRRLYKPNVVDNDLNPLLNPNIKLISNGKDKHKAVLYLKPVYDSNNNVIKAVKEFKYSYNNIMTPAKTLKSKQMDILNSNGQLVKKEALQEVELDVDINLQTPIKIDLIIHDKNGLGDLDYLNANLKIDYSSKTEGYDDGKAKKSKLIEKIEYFNSEAMKSNLAVIPQNKLKTLNELLKQATALVKDDDAKQADVDSTVEKLNKEDNNLKTLITMYNTLASIKKSYEEWQKSDKYTKESLAQIGEKIKDIEKAIEKDLTSDEAINYTNQLKDLQSQLILDTSKLQEKIKEAKEKLNKGSYTDEQKKPLLDFIKVAQDYIKNINAKTEHKDLIKEYMDKFDLLMKDLEKIAPPTQDETKIYTVSVRFLNVKDTNKESHANATLVQRAKLEVKGNENKLTLNLKPLVNRQGEVSGVLTDLFYYKDGLKTASEKLNTKTIEIGFQGKKKTYQYPTQVSMMVDGSTKHLKCNIVSGTPVFDEPHADDVILEIDYVNKSEGYNENEADKTELKAIVNILESEYYKSLKSVIPSHINEKLQAELEKANQVLQNINSTQEDVRQSSEKLAMIKDLIDFYITLDTQLRDVEASYKSDEKDVRFSQESKTKARKYIDDKKMQIQEYIKQDNFSINDANILLRQLSDYYKLLRYDTQALEQKINEAQEKINSNKYTKDTTDALNIVLSKANEFVAKAKETRNIQDDRDLLIKEIDNAIKALVEKQEEPKNYDTTKLEQKINEAQAKIDSQKYTDISTKALKELLEKARAYVEEVKQKKAEKDETQDYIRKIDTELSTLVEKNQSPRIISKQVKVEFKKPDKTPSMTNNFLIGKEFKLTYDEEKNTTRYEMTFLDVSATNSLSTSTISDNNNAYSEKQIQNINSKVQNTTSSNQLKTDDISLNNEVKDQDTMMIWYEENGEYKKAQIVKKDGKNITFAFEKQGKPLEEVGMRLYVPIMNSTNDIVAHLDVKDFDKEEDNSLKEIKDYLQSLIKKAQELKMEEYTKESSENLNKQIEDAKNILSKADTNKDQLDMTIAKLKDAINNLKKKDDKKPQDTPDNKPKQDEDKKPQNPGTSDNKTVTTVGVWIENISKEGEKSMADMAVNPTMSVEEENGKAKYKIYFKPIKIGDVNGNITGLYTYADGVKIPASVISSDGEYNIGFEFERNTLREEKIKVAFDVEAMHTSQDAYLVLLWNGQQRPDTKQSTPGTSSSSGGSGGSSSISPLKQAENNLDDTIKKAEEKIKEKEKYTKETVSELEKAIENAKKAKNMKDKTQEELKKASEKLELAIKQLKLKENKKDEIEKMPKTSQTMKKGYVSGYKDGTFRPNANITRGELAVILAKLIDEDVNMKTVNFTDVSKNSWTFSSIQKLVSLGIISGYENNTFKPDKEVTRAEYASIIARFKNISSKNDKFKDIKNHWAKDAINACQEKGYINGYKDGSFKPQNKLTRAEATVITNKVFDIKPSKEVLKQIENKEMPFKDVSSTNWFYIDVMMAR